MLGSFACPRWTTVSHSGATGTAIPSRPHAPPRGAFLMAQAGRCPHGARTMPADPMTRQCTATAKATGWRCRHRPMRGQRVCRHHGGSAPQAKAAVERRDERDEAERAVQTYGLPRDIAPDEALLEEVHRTAGHASSG